MSLDHLAVWVAESAERGYCKEALAKTLKLQHVAPRRQATLGLLDGVSGTPVMICPPPRRMPVIDNWLERHRNPTSFVLHMIGIPPTILGVLLIPIYVLLVSIPIFLLALTLFVGGYLVQFLGHAVDGTEPGEIKFLRGKFGWTYAGIPPTATPATGSNRGVA
jgi:hypothetical protein